MASADRSIDATKGPAWDLSDKLNPQPKLYPVCGDCRAAYEYRQFFDLMNGGTKWAWSKPAKVPKGCRHTAAAVFEDERKPKELPQ